jgi:hypothetical protein
MKAVDPAQVEGDNSWTMDLPADAEEVAVRVCSKEDGSAPCVAELGHSGDA